MKQFLTLSAALLLSTVPALAQNTAPSGNAATTAAMTVDPLMQQVTYLQNEWARIKYQIPDDDSKLAAIRKLEAHAEKVTAAYPRPEAKIWEAIILSTEAGIIQGMSALPKVKKAKTLLESALAQDPRALDGSAYTSLGSLYYQVPGWPVAFGDDDEAEKNLKAALQINPNGIDPNYFYGDFLLQDGRPEEAKAYLQRALLAPERPGRSVADSGRRLEIQAALAKAAENLKTGGMKFN